MGQLFCLYLHRVGDSVKEAPSLSRSDVRPRAILERMASRPNRAINIVGTGGCNLGQSLAGGRIQRGENRPVGSWHPLTAYPQLLRFGGKEAPHLRTELDHTHATRLH